MIAIDHNESMISLIANFEKLTSLICARCLDNKHAKDSFASIDTHLSSLVHKTILCMQERRDLDILHDRLILMEKEDKDNAVSETH